MGFFDTLKDLPAEEAQQILDLIHHRNPLFGHRLTSKSGDNFLLVPEEKFKDHLNAFHTALNAFYNDYGSPDKG
ncbi:hypothetical protein C1Y41_04475 [Pantoea sp. ICBG 1758]|uniref:hypothetical protein n=1 Tax=Pantoea sp. ICBG 1758 TaxID=2071682 RepID=UPI000CE451BE|nr:hypothetical protein [Pantoea sp. ICBG 1758]PPC63905.1 hypothetical protein C1Y41_04475 [Pantoea sp. ICBG 1758]